MLIRSDAQAPHRSHRCIAHHNTGAIRTTALPAPPPLATPSRTNTAGRQQLDHQPPYLSPSTSLLQTFRCIKLAGIIHSL